ncbi:MAG: hypothetical protein L0Y71_05705 [Gemmataceae bacterium]|nr:hypothetical protein [Gemmataceae bacterium]
MKTTLRTLAPLAAAVAVFVVLRPLLALEPQWLEWLMLPVALAVVICIIVDDRAGETRKSDWLHRAERTERIEPVEAEHVEADSRIVKHDPDEHIRRT